MRGPHTTHGHAVESARGPRAGDLGFQQASAKTLRPLLEGRHFHNSLLEKGLDVDWIFVV